MKKMLLTALAVMTLGTEANAAVGCQGVVNHIALTPEGDVYVDWGSWGMKACLNGATVSVNRGSSGSASINPSTCEALYSGFVTAKASGKPVLMYVDRSDCTFTGGANGLPDPYPYVIYFLKQ